MSWTYTYSRETMSWTDAKAWCENRSSWLMVIPNKTHNDYLKDNLPQQHKMYYWIGLRKTQGNWTWQGTAQRLEDGGSWADKEPNNKRQDEDCVEIYINNGTQNGKWNDENCNKKKHALCYDGKDIYVSMREYFTNHQGRSEYTWIPPLVFIQYILHYINTIQR